MAAETEILRLLFSMSGIRSIYSTFLQGPDRAQSQAQLQSGLQELFPHEPEWNVASVAATVWHAARAAEQFQDVMGNIQRLAGPGWPGNVQTGEFPGSEALVDFSGAASIPSLTIPGAPAANFVVTSLITGDVTHLDGSISQRTIQVVLAFDSPPTIAELTNAMVTEATLILDSTTNDSERGSFVIDTTTLQPQVSLGFMLMTTTVAGD